MVILAASICTRGGKAVLSRQFREIARSRIEALLASFPKLADSSTQHTTVEQDSVRYVYQPLDELYMVLITNRQSNILQDIDSLHLFAQVVTSICKTLEEREILRNAFELLSAFDELVSQGYRENLSLSQIKTFLEMESHEERIQEIIARNKELEASEERKRKAKQLEMQRKEASRSGRAIASRAPSYPSYTPSPRITPRDTYDAYEAEKSKSFKPSAPKGKGMQLGKKSKTTDMFEKVRGDLGHEAEETVPLVTAPQTSNEIERSTGPLASNHDALHVTIAETISARLSREGSLKSFEVKGELQLRISDSSLAKVRLDLSVSNELGANYRTHPSIDKPLFNSSKAIQLRDTTKEFPVDISLGVLKWKASAKADDSDVLPVSFAVWVNKSSSETYAVTIEYEFQGSDELADLSVIIPFQTSEPVVSSHDANYEMSGDTLEWNIGKVNEENQAGSFEFEGSAEDENEFFPMDVRFSKSKPHIEVDVNSITLMDIKTNVPFSKEVKSATDSYVIE